MMDAKKALLETGGDLEAAQDWLRTKGLLKAEKKSSRIAAEGLVGVRVQGDTGMIVELNSETDFVATNKEFIELVDLVLSEGFGITDKTITALKSAQGLVCGSLLCKTITNSLRMRQNPVTKLDKVVYNLKKKIL